MSFDWAALIARIVHPTKVAIIEALEYLGQPLSPSDLTKLLGDDQGIYLSLVSYHAKKLVTVKLFGREDYYLSLVSHHARSLEKAGVLSVVDTGRKRGAVEHFYAITDHMLVRR